MAKLKTVRLKSDPVVSAPGIFKYIQHQHATDKDAAIRLLMRWYTLDQETATGLLDGTISHQVEGGDVVFQIEIREITNTKTE